ncbi:MAG: ATP-binding protein [Bacilli bacterium]
MINQANRHFTYAVGRLGVPNLLLAILSHMSESVAVFDLEARLMMVNAAWESMFGVREDDVIGRCLAGGDTRQEFLERCEALLAERKQVVSYTTTVSGLHAEVVLAPVRNDQGMIVAVAMIAQDITEQIGTQQTIDRMRRMNVQAQRLAEIGSWEWDMVNASVTWSDHMFHIWRTDRSKFPLHPQAIFATIHPDDREFVRRAVNDALQSASLDVQYRVVVPPGKQIVIRSIAKTEYDESGQARRMTGAAQDITQQLQLQERLFDSEGLSAAGKLAAGIAHEIRNPVTVVKGFLTLLTQSPSQLASYAPIMIEELARIETIMEEFLELGRHREPKFAFCGYRDIVFHVSTLMSVEAKLRDVDLQVDCQSDDAPIWCNAHQIRQALINLIKNAIDAMKAGGILIVRAVTQGSVVHISIVDHGEGMSFEQVNKLGTPFFTTKETGTGLGMTICQSIVAAHRGTVEVESVAKQGTTITIHLPLAMPGDAHSLPEDGHQDT